MAKKKTSKKKTPSSPKRSATRKASTRKAKPKGSSKTRQLPVPVKVATPEIVDSSVVPVLAPHAPRSTTPLAPAPEQGALVSQDPLIAYLAEIRKYPLLTPEEEHDLAVRYRESGDKEAAERLVTANLRFVVKIAAEYSKFGAKMIDLIQEGNVGLMHAVREFNPYKNVRLITYAVWWIRGYIREYLMRQHSMVRVGTTQAQKKLFYNLQKETRELEASGQKADVKALSERIGVSEEDVIEMQKRMSAKDVSLDQPLDEDSGTNLLSLRADDSAESPEEALMASEQTALLKKKLDLIIPTLNEKERYILEERLLSDEPLTLQDVGDKFGITRERARQLEARVLQKIRKEFEEVRDKEDPSP